MAEDRKVYYYNSSQQKELRIQAITVYKVNKSQLQMDLKWILYYFKKMNT